MTAKKYVWRFYMPRDPGWPAISVSSRKEKRRLQKSIERRRHLSKQLGAVPGSALRRPVCQRETRGSEPEGMRCRPPGTRLAAKRRGSQPRGAADAA